MKKVLLLSFLIIITSFQLKAQSTTDNDTIEVTYNTGTEKIFLTPSAFNLKKNQWEYRNVLFFLNSIEYGITNHISVGVDVFPTFSTYLIGAKIKGTLDISKKIHLFAGARIHNYDFDSFIKGTMSSYFAGVSIGSRKEFLNFSYGIMSSVKKYKPERHFSIGGSLIFKDKWKLLVDSFINIDEDDGTIIFLGIGNFKNRHYFNIGFSAILFADDRIRIIPVAGYGLRF